MRKPVVVGRKLRCPVCGCAGCHGCMGPSRKWQGQLIEEIAKLRNVLQYAVDMGEAQPANALWLVQQAAIEALKVDPEEDPRR